MHLRPMRTIKVLDRLEFNNHLPVTNKIGFIGLPKFDVSIGNSQFLLAFVWYVTFLKFNFQCFLIHGFEKSRTERVINVHGCTNNHVTLFRINQFHFLIFKRY